MLNMYGEKKWAFVPIIFSLGIIPMIVHMHSYRTSYVQYAWYPDSAGLQSDFFLYYKMVAILIIGIVMLGMMAYHFRYSKDRFRSIEREWICMGIYVFCVCFSALLSVDKTGTFKGEYEVFEPVWVLLAYVVMCLYSYYSINSEAAIKFVLTLSAIGYLIITLIGFFQYCGFDLFRTTFGKMLITPPSYWSQIDSLSFTFELGNSYATLYNTNYLPFYYGMGIPMITLLIFGVKKNYQKLLLAVLDILSIVTLIGSNSKTGLAALGITVVLAMIIMWKKWIKHIYVPIIVIIVFGMVLFNVSARYGGIGQLISLFTTGLSEMNKEYLLDNVETTETDVVFYYHNNTEVHLDYENVEGLFYVYAKDESGNEIATQTNEDDPLYLDIGDEAYGSMTVAPVYLDEEQTILAMKVTVDGQSSIFTKEYGDHTYYFYNFFDKYEKLSPIERSRLLPRGIFSGRGDIWDKIIPKLKQCILFGTGANTFTVVYPNNDYIIKNYLGTIGIFDVKAHSYYFQLLLEEGGIAFLAFLVFYLFYFVKSLKLYFGRKEYDFMSLAGLAAFLGTFNYMIVALANDSTVNTAPVYWTMLGIGMSINHICKTEQKTVSGCKNLS